jgi:hypothetical protein
MRLDDVIAHASRCSGLHAKVCARIGWFIKRRRRMNTPRPVPLTAAAILLAIVSVLNLGLSLLVLSHPKGFPLALTYAGVVVGVSGLVAVFGLWQTKRWGLLVTIIVSALTVVASAPGLVGSPNLGLLMSAVVQVAVCLVIIVLVLLPSARKAYAA